MCDTIVRLTESGVLFAKNSDRDPNEAQVLEWVPAGEHPRSAVVRCTWIDVPQVERTHAVVLSRPWWMWGAEMGANSHGVAIGNEAVFTKGLAARVRKDGPSLLGMDLLRLALERSATADEGVSTIVGLLEKYGQGGPCSHEHPRFTYDNSFIIADPNSAFVLETAGRDWEVEQVPAGSTRSLSNGLTIPRFARLHEDPIRTRVADAAKRRSCTQSAADRGDGSVAGLMAALRSHADSSGGGLNYSPVNGAMSAPCMHAGGLVANSQTTASWVSDLRPDPLHWATATAAPCTSLFKPVRVGTPLGHNPHPAQHFDQRSIWWRHELLHRLALRDIEASAARFADERDSIEAKWLLDPPQSDEAFAMAGELEVKWTSDLAAAYLPDVRPLWASRYWARQNRHAGLSHAAPTQQLTPDTPTLLSQTIAPQAAAGRSDMDGQENRIRE
ncbi:MAG: hypothetical protein WBF71_03510 [Microthrixaceae bacterium]